MNSSSPTQQHNHPPLRYPSMPQMRQQSPAAGGINETAGLSKSGGLVSTLYLNGGAPHRQTTSGNPTVNGSNAYGGLGYVKQAGNGLPSMTECTQQVMHPGHHRDKLDQIRNQLKPYEQIQSEEQQWMPIEHMSNFREPNFASTSNSEPSQEIQGILIDALTGLGYDKESAYYALKLVNFSSVTDAANVLASIKQPSTSASHYNGTNTGDLVPTNMLSESARAALSRYGVSTVNGFSNGNDSHPLGTTVSIGSSGDRMYSSATTSAYPHVMQQLPISNSEQFTNSVGIYNTSQPGDLKPLNSIGFDESFSSGESSTRSEISSMGQIPFTVAVEGDWQINDPSKQRGFQQVADNYTKHQAHTVLRHANSFNVNPSERITVTPARPHANSAINTGGAAAAIQRRQTQLHAQPATPSSSSSSTVIRIERNSTFSTPGGHDRRDHREQHHDSRQEATTNGGFVNAHSTSRIATMSMPLEQNNFSLTSQPVPSRMEDPRHQKSPSPHTYFLQRPAPLLTSKLLTSPPTVIQVNQNKPVERRERIPVSTTFSATAVQPQKQPLTNAYFDTSGSAVQNIMVDYGSDRENENNAVVQRISHSPPPYDEYMEELCRHTAQSRVTTDEVKTSGLEQHPQKQRCISPLPESISRRTKTNAYEKFVKPCKPGLFRFFMEQHIEKLIQQYRERNQRVMQLTKEMEAAGLAENMKEQMLRLLRQKESKYIRLKRQKMNKNMFDMIRHIGVGAFGKVTLVRKKDAGQIYAMKTLSKEDVIQKQQAAHVRSERDILAEANSKWIVKLFFSFQDSNNLYFIMEYVPGGDMMQLLINKGIFSERLARFYIAELTCAIEYVHGLGFIHRDIKPDNILIDKNGHIKLTDFGLCTGLRWTHDKRHYVIYDDDGSGSSHFRDDSFSLPAGLVGNENGKVKLLEYRHHKKRHTQLCDWWSVGVILYEMVYGRPPFMSEDPQETQYMIVNWRRFLNLDNPMGARLSQSCVDFIARLCCDTDMRLGGHNGAKDVKAHLWFKGIDFMNLRNIRADYIPQVAHPEDTSNFDTFEVTSDEFMTLGRGISSQSGGPHQKYNPAFFDFTFRHFFASDVSNANGSGSPGRGHHQQPKTRPTLAPLVEIPSSSANSSPSKNTGTNNGVQSTQSQYNTTTISTIPNMIPPVGKKTVPAPPAPINKQ
ncbi:protein kinase domain-containing protein [Ditylenchus destructor]|nr:protein kinase domain-containing protein [Ditylenchus destructor]